MSDDWEEFSEEAEGVLLYHYEKVRHEQHGRTIREFQGLAHITHLPGRYLVWAATHGREKLREVEARYSGYRKQIFRSTGMVTYIFTNMRASDEQKCYKRYLEDKAENFGYE